MWSQEKTRQGRRKSQAESLHPKLTDEEQHLRLRAVQEAKAAEEEQAQAQLAEVVVDVVTPQEEDLYVLQELALLLLKRKEGFALRGTQEKEIKVKTVWRRSHTSKTF